MNLSKHLLLIALGLLSFGTASAADFYGQLGAGALFVQDDEANDIEFATGSSVSATVGWQINPAWALELQSGHLRASLNTFRDLDSTDRDLGAVTMIPALVNVSHRFTLTERFSLLLGVGGGTIRIEEGQVLSPLGVDHDRWDPVFQGSAQLCYAIGDRASLSVGWRYMASGLESDELRAHAFELGYRWGF
jgi:opacity protein-like surface antigen